MDRLHPCTSSATSDTMIHLRLLLALVLTTILSGAEFTLAFREARLEAADGFTETPWRLNQPAWLGADAGITAAHLVNIEALEHEGEYFIAITLDAAGGALNQAFTTRVTGKRFALVADGAVIAVQRVVRPSAERVLVIMSREDGGRLVGAFNAFKEAAAAPPAEATPAAAPLAADAATAKFSLRFAEAAFEPAPGLSETPYRPGKPVFLGADAGIGAAHVVRIEAAESAGESVLSITLDEAGAALNHAFTTARLGKHLAIVINGRVATVAKVLAPSRETVWTTGPSREEIAEIVASFGKR